MRTVSSRTVRIFLKNAGYNKEETLQSSSRNARKLGVEMSRASLIHFLNPCGRDDVTEIVLLDGLVREVVDFSDGEDISEDEVEEDTEEKLPNFTLQLDALILARSILDSHVHLSEEASKTLLKCQRAMNVEENSRMRQSTIGD